MIRNQSGQFTIESTLIFPLLFIITISCLLITISATRHVGVSIDATTTAGRAAFSWMNSNKNPLTGSYYPDRYDDLYWRISSDWSGSALAKKKVSKSIALIPERTVDRAEFNNYILQRDVHVDLTDQFRAPSFMQQLYGSRELIGRGHSTISEPTELIRQVELARTYWPMIKEVFSTEQAEEAVEEFRQRPGKSAQELPDFYSESQAKAYLRELVKGRYGSRDTDIDHRRVLDALDNNGIAHQAYYGYKDVKTDTIKTQFMKDEEILGKGLVNGVVWHFFRNGNNQSIGPSDQLREALEARGIVIVVHE